MPRIRFSFTDSAGARLFWVKDFCSFQKGEFAEVRAPSNDPYFKSLKVPVERLVKRFSCMPGETISRQGLDFYCNNWWVARAKLRATNGEPLHPWTPDGNMTIPQNMYFMANPFLNSYDSRYIGLVHKKDILNCLIPIF